MARFRDTHVILADLRRCDGYYGRVVRYRKAKPRSGVELHMWSNGEHTGVDDYATLAEAEASFRHEGPCLPGEDCRFTRTVAAKSPKAANADSLFAAPCKAHGRTACLDGCHTFGKEAVQGRRKEP